MKLRLKIASENDLSRIHDASLKILSETGCVVQSEKALGILKKRGAKVEGKTAYFPEALVASAIETAPRTFPERGRGGQKRIFCPEAYRKPQQ